MKSVNMFLLLFLIPCVLSLNHNRMKRETKSELFEQINEINFKDKSMDEIGTSTEATVKEMTSAIQAADQSTSEENVVEISSTTQTEDQISTEKNTVPDNEDIKENTEGVEEITNEHTEGEKPNKMFFLNGLKCKDKNLKDENGKYIFSWLVKECADKPLFNKGVGTLPIPMVPPPLADFPVDLKPLKPVNK